MAKRNSGSSRRRKRTIAVRAEWHKAVAAWSISIESWDLGWGPPPDDPECLCPHDILADALSGESDRAGHHRAPSFQPGQPGAAPV